MTTVLSPPTQSETPAMSQASTVRTWDSTTSTAGDNLTYQNATATLTSDHNTRPTLSHLSPHQPLTILPSTAQTQGSSFIGNGQYESRHAASIGNSLSLQQMASHFSIPSRLPAPPGTGSTSRPSQPVIRMTPPQPPQPVVTANGGPDFSSLFNNYLKMLAEPASEPAHESPNVGTAELEGTGATDEASINWAEFLSPAYSDSNAEFGGDVSLDTYLTSPLIDEYDEFTSPLMDTPLLDFTSPNMDTSPMLSDLNTPVIQDQDASWDQPLIVDASVDMYKQQTLQVPTPSSTKATASQLDYDGLLKMSPGNTPAIQSFGDQFPSPAMTMDHSFSPSVATTSLPRPHRDVPTGTRRNITPQSLIPEDAPTQSRRYVTPSATSRKEVPSTFSRKRSRPADDEGDELDEPLPPNATEREMIEYKRRQNTLAARKSRRRKLEHMQNLEDSVTRLTREVEQWKTRTEFLEGLCINHGLLGAGGVGLNGAVYPQGV